MPPRSATRVGVVGAAAVAHERSTARTAAWLTARRALAEHLRRVAARIDERCCPQVDEVARALVDGYDGGGRVYTFGNGGSAADAQHFAGELVGRYQRERRPLPAQSR